MHNESCWKSLEHLCHLAPFSGMQSSAPPRLTLPRRCALPLHVKAPTLQPPELLARGTTQPAQLLPVGQLVTTVLSLRACPMSFIRC